MTHILYGTAAPAMSKAIHAQIDSLDIIECHLRKLNGERSDLKE